MLSANDEFGARAFRGELVKFFLPAHAVTWACFLTVVVAVLMPSFLAEMPQHDRARF